MNIVQPIRDLNVIEDIKLYLKQRNRRNYLLFLLGVNTGLRISDILKLKIKDIKGMHISIREMKTGKYKRIRITPFLRRELNPYLEGRDPEEYIIQSRQGKNKPLCRSMAYRILNDVAKEFNLSEIGTHTLRKTFGYHFYKQTNNIALLMDIFNHSSERVTLRYIGINQDMKDKAMAKFKI